MEKHTPTIFGLLKHLCSCIKFKKMPLTAKIGILMLALNMPIGWGGAAICAALAASQPEHRAMWGIAAGAIYGISWIVLGLGVVFTGKDLYNQLKTRRKTIIAAWKRLKAYRKAHPLPAHPVKE